MPTPLSATCVGGERNSEELRVAHPLFLRLLAQRDRSIIQSVYGFTPIAMRQRTKRRKFHSLPVSPMSDEYATPHRARSWPCSTYRFASNPLTCPGLDEKSVASSEKCHNFSLFIRRRFRRSCQAEFSEDRGCADEIVPIRRCVRLLGTKGEVKRDRSSGAARTHRRGRGNRHGNARRGILRASSLPRS